MPPPPYRRSIFLNIPLDEKYGPIARAIIFTVFDCGFVPRSALESDDSTQTRIAKLYDLIEQSKYGIHDISRTQLSGQHRLPRFNMPLELGLFMGAKHYGDDRHRQKRGLVLDREKYRYQHYISDISGQDVRTHSDTVGGAIDSVRAWLRAIPESGSAMLPTSERIKRRYGLFRRHLPTIARRLGFETTDLGFIDFCTIVAGWLRANPPNLGA